MIDLAQMEHGLDQYAEGKYRKIEFSEAMYKSKYKRHLASVQEWCQLHPTVTRNIRMKMFRRAL